MRSLFGAMAMALLLVGISGVASTPASARCLGLSGTADGFDYETAVTRAQAAVGESVSDIKSKYKVRSVSLRPLKMSPQPYWRDAVPADVYVKPDVVTRQTHTVCWHGVVSPYVCTSGARACF